MPNQPTHLDAITQAFRTEFGDLSTEALNWKPAPDTWSIGQNIDHLITINRTYFPTFEAVLAGTNDPPFTARLGFLVSWFGNMILKASSPERSNKIKTFPIWEPSQSDLPADILARFADHQEKLKGYIEKLAPKAAEGTIISSPANRYLVYRLDTAFEIIVTHEERHFAQAREVAAARRGVMPE